MQTVYYLTDADCNYTLAVLWSFLRIVTAVSTMLVYGICLFAIVGVHLKMKRKVLYTNRKEVKLTISATRNT